MKTFKIITKEEILYDHIEPFRTDVFSANLQNRILAAMEEYAHLKVAESRRPQHKEIVWDEGYAFCGEQDIGYVTEYMDSNGAYYYEYTVLGETDTCNTILKAKQAVEQAFTDFYKEITK